MTVSRPSRPHLNALRTRGDTEKITYCLSLHLRLCNSLLRDAALGYNKSSWKTTISKFWVAHRASSDIRETVFSPSLLNKRGPIFIRQVFTKPPLPCHAVPDIYRSESPDGNCKSDRGPPKSSYSPSRKFIDGTEEANTCQ
jgi:hypothetical protein